MKGRRKTLISASVGLLALATGGSATLAHDLGGAEAAPDAGHMMWRGMMDDMASRMRDVMRGLMDHDSTSYPGSEIPQMPHVPAIGIDRGGMPRMPQMSETPVPAGMPGMSARDFEMQMAPGWSD